MSYYETKEFINIINYLEKCDRLKILYKDFRTIDIRAPYFNPLIDILYIYSLDLLDIKMFINNLLYNNMLYIYLSTYNYNNEELNLFLQFMYLYDEYTYIIFNTCLFEIIVNKYVSYTKCIKYIDTILYFFRNNNNYMFDFIIVAPRDCKDLYDIYYKHIIDKQEIKYFLCNFNLIYLFTYRRLNEPLYVLNSFNDPSPDTKEIYKNNLVALHNVVYTYGMSLYRFCWIIAVIRGIQKKHN